MAQKKLEIFNPDNTFLCRYHDNSNALDDKGNKLAKRSVHIDLHNQYVRVIPAEFTGSFVSNHTCIPRKDVYEHIRKARQEARDLNLQRPGLMLGLDTHTIELKTKTVGLTPSCEVDIILNLKNVLVQLPSFQKLVDKYEITSFSLGRLPFHSNILCNAFTELAREYKHARIHGVFLYKRKKEMITKVSIGIGMTDEIFGLRKANNIFIEDFEEGA